MAIERKPFPVNEDAAIDKIQVALYDRLVTNGTWTNYESYHRAYKNETSDGIRPEIFRGTDKGNDYWDSFNNDDFNATSFFLIPDNIPVVDGMHTANISIIFQVDLEKIYPTAPHRFDAEMHSEIETILSKLDGTFIYIDTHTSISSVYDGLDTSKVKWDNMQRFHVVRFEIEARYVGKVCSVFATGNPECNVFVEVDITNESSSGANDGQAFADVSGDQGNITFLWDDPLAQTTQTATNLSPNTYEVIVSDDITAPIECTATASGEVLAGAFSFGNALSMDGVFESVSHAQFTANADYTTSYWLYPNIDKEKSIVIAGNGINFSQIWFSNTIHRINHGGTMSFFVMPASFQGGQWNHVVETSIGGILRVYYNDVESTTGGVANAGSRLFMNISGEDFKFNGLIDEYAVLNGTGASAANVSSLFNSENGEDFNTVMGSSTVYLHMNESGSDMIAVDSSGNNNDGTLDSFSSPPPDNWVLHV